MSNQITATSIPQNVQYLFKNTALREATPVLPEPSLIDPIRHIKGIASSLASASVFNYIANFRTPSPVANPYFRDWVVSVYDYVANWNNPPVESSSSSNWASWVVGMYIAGVALEGVRRFLRGPNYDPASMAGNLVKRGDSPMPIEPGVTAAHPREEYWSPFLNLARSAATEAGKEIGVLAAFQQGERRLLLAFSIEPTGNGEYKYRMAVPGASAFDQLDLATQSLDQEKPIGFQMRFFQKV